MKRLFLAVLIVLPGWSAIAQSRTYDTVPFLVSHYHERLALFKKEHPNKNKIVFLGNSITEGGDWKKLLKDSTVINRGISGDNTFGVLSRLDEVIAHKPAKLFIKIGINDLAKAIPDEVVMENIFSIVRRVKVSSPQTQVFVQSVLPTNNSFKNNVFPRYDKNDHVIVINNQLIRYAEKIGFTYIDLVTKFQDKEGKLDVRYTSDGLHLNAVGYQHWVEVLKEGKYL